MPIQEITLHQQSFSSGEISPLTHDRYGSVGRTAGCKELINMIPDSRGPAISREGSKFIQEFTGNNGRIFGHAVTNSFFYSIILLDLEMRIASVDGTVPSVNHAVNSRFHTLGSSWVVGLSDGSQAVDFAQHDCLLEVTSNPNKWSRISQQVTVPGAGNYKVVVQTSGGAAYRVDVGTSPGDPAYATLDSSATEEIIDITVPGTTFYITITKDSNDGYEHVHVNFFGVGDDPIVAPIFVTPWGEDELADVQAIPVPAGDTTYFIHPLYAPRKLSYDIATDTFTFTTPSLSNTPSVWAGSNWPSMGVYFQGRLWLGATPEQPQTIWSSKSLFPENFDAGTGLDDESVVIVMAAYGQIEWAGATKNLLIGTEAGEHIVTSEGGVITPGDHQVEQQSAYGSASIQAHQVGDQIFYISADRVKLRAMQYEWAANNWLSVDLTYFSEHITTGKMRAAAWLQNPANLFVMIIDDGTFATLSYDRSNNIYGWAQHNIGDDCIDINVTSVNGVSVLGMLVQRKDGVIHYESQAGDSHYSHNLHDDHTKVVRYMDSWIEEFIVTPTTAISGLDHLEGRTVQVLVDGATHPDKVVSSGSITLEREATETVVVGLKFVAKLTLLPFEETATMGSSAPYWKALHQLNVHLLDSAHPLVNGKRAPTRSPSTPMGDVEPLVTGKSTVNLLGWKNETDITIEQDLPFPLIITGVSGKLKQDTL